MTISDKIRIYELSRDLKLENKDVLDAAQKLSISVKSHSSSISLEDAKKITNLITNKNPSKKIISVSKSTFKAKTEKPKNNDNQKQDAKTLSNTLHPEKPSKQGLNKKPILIKPVNKPDDSLVILKMPISDNLFTCVPPHNSTLYGFELLSPIMRTLTSSSYFSPNKANAPVFNASSYFINFVSTEKFEEITLFTNVSIRESSFLDKAL